jgi:phage terminase large subunit GpA-like protein
MSEWAERHRVLSAESSANHGEWRNERTPYGVEIMDTISGRLFNDITVVAPSQSAKTELGILNPIGYYMDQEPSSILVIQPNVKPMAESFSKERLAPMIRDTPRLRGRVKDAKSRDSGNTILQKTFPGGFIVVVGANSPAGLASRPIRVVLADEIDRWPASAGTEGDPLALAEARTKTFRHRKKVVKVSSPGNEGESRIEKEWAKSDQRHFEVPCPHCSQVAGGPSGWQVLEWRCTGGKPDIRPGKGPFRLVWEKTEDEQGQVTHHPETVAYLCRHCHALIEETAKTWMLANGRWVRHNPNSSRAGFHIPAMLLTWVRWHEIAEAWLRAKDDDEERKAFFNTVLGLLYVHDGVQLDPDALANRREAFSAEVPGGAAVLTMSLDVQGNRLEAAVWAWGEGEECWLVYFERLDGDPSQEDTEAENVWVRAEKILNREWIHESGARMRIMRCAVDAGYLTDRVYKFTKPREGRGVYAVMGSDDLKVPLSRATRNNRDKVKLWTFNPTAFKDVVFPRLTKPSPGPGYMHFGLYETTKVDDEFLRQFAAEKRSVEFKGNKVKVRYVKLAGKRNEAVDLATMGLVALRTLGDSFVRSLGVEVKRLWKRGVKEKEERAEEERSNPKPSEPDPPPSPPPPAARRPPPRRSGGGWVNGWKR